MNTTMCLAVADAKITCHYLGRPTEGQAGQRLPGRGTARVAASISAGASVTVQRTWPKADRNPNRPAPIPRSCRRQRAAVEAVTTTSRVKPKDDQ